MRKLKYSCVEEDDNFDEFCFNTALLCDVEIRTILEQHIATQTVKIWSEFETPSILRDLLFHRGDECCVAFVPPLVQNVAIHPSLWKYPEFLFGDNMHMIAYYCRFGVFWCGVNRIIRK